MSGSGLNVGAYILRVGFKVVGFGQTMANHRIVR